MLIIQLSDTDEVVIHYKNSELQAMNWLGH